MTKQATDFDICDTRDLESAEIQLKRNGIPLPIFVTMAGPEHPLRKRFVLDKQRKARKALARSGKFEFADPSDEEAEQLDLISRCTLKWRTGDEQGVVLGGERLDCTPGNVIKAISAPERAWLRRSMQDAFDDGEAFISTSALA